MDSIKQEVEDDLARTRLRSVSGAITRTGRGSMKSKCSLARSGRSFSHALKNRLRRWPRAAPRSPSDGFRYLERCRASMGLLGLFSTGPYHERDS